MIKLGPGLELLFEDSSEDTHAVTQSPVTSPGGSTDSLPCLVLQVCDSVCEWTCAFWGQ